jgi:TonB family protein
MLHPFVSAPAANVRRWSHAHILSVAIHASLLSLAIAATQEPRVIDARRNIVERVRFTDLSYKRVGTARARPGVVHRRRGLVPLHTPSFVPLNVSLPMDMPSVAPLPDINPALVDTLWTDGRAANFSDSGAGRGGSHGGGGDVDVTLVYVESAVERMAAPSPANRAPEYPREMVNRGIEASFHVRFVIDTVGRIEDGTIEMPATVHTRFARAVLDVLVGWHFSPAELRGRPVRQQVDQPFVFQIVR